MAQDETIEQARWAILIVRSWGTGDNRGKRRLKQCDKGGARGRERGSAMVSGWREYFTGWGEQSVRTFKRSTAVDPQLKGRYSMNRTDQY